MNPFDLPDANEELRLAVAERCDRELAEEYVAYSLATGRWKSAAVSWLYTARSLARVADNPDDALDDVLGRLLTAVEQESLSLGWANALHNVRVLLCDQVWKGKQTSNTTPLLQRLFSYIAQQFQPGVSQWVASQLRHSIVAARDQDYQVAALAQPLVWKLLRQGAAELRRPENSRLCWQLSMTMDSKSDLLPLALRYLVSTARGQRNVFHHDDDVWTPVEAALAQQNIAAGLAVDFAWVLLRSKDVWIKRVWDPLAEPSRWPRVREALLFALFDGEFDFQDEAKERPQFREQTKTCAVALNAPARVGAAWEILIASGQSPPALRIRHARTVSLALGAAHYFAPGGREQRGRFEVLEKVDLRFFPDWLTQLLIEYLRVHDAATVAPSAKVTAGLTLFTGWPNTGSALVEAMREYLRKVPADRLVTSRALLEAWPDASGREARALVLSLKPSQAVGPDPAPHNRWEDYAPTLCQLLDAFIHHGWTEPVFGVDLLQLLGTANKVSFTSLEGDDLVEVDGDTLKVDTEYLAMQLADPDDVHLALARCALYVVHELIHHAQAIGKKEVVTQLRQTGAEATLMHFDLVADHAAALILAECQPEWTVRWLKDVQGRALVDFPVTSQHFAAARARKANRLVALRADFFMRECGHVAEDDGAGHVFVEFSPGSGVAIVAQRGPPMKILQVGTISPQQVFVFDGAADKDAAETESGYASAISAAKRIEAIDRVISTVWGS